MTPQEHEKRMQSLEARCIAYIKDRPPTLNADSFVPQAVTVFFREAGIPEHPEQTAALVSRIAGKVDLRTIYSGSEKRKVTKRKVAKPVAAKPAPHSAETRCPWQNLAEDVEAHVADLPRPRESRSEFDPHGVLAAEDVAESVREWLGVTPDASVPYAAAKRMVDAFASSKNVALGHKHSEVARRLA